MLSASLLPSLSAPNTKPEASSWLMTGSNLDPSFGGISSAVRSLAEVLQRQRACHVSLAAFGEIPVENGAPPELRETRFPLANGPWFREKSHLRSLTEEIRNADGVHVHGLWQKHCALSAHLARRSGKPYLISAHGMLDSWALANKRWKKTLYSLLVEQHTLRGTACLHALTHAEAADYRKIAPKVPVAVIPNGVTIPQADSALFLEKFPHLRGRSILLFLGRIHFKKGLDVLCRAWETASGKYPDVQLVLAGPDFENTRASVENLIAQLGIQSRVTFTGMLSGDMKWSALAASDFFVLPSYSEGFSVAVLEALGMGIPVIVSEYCHIPEVAAEGCGWVVSPQTEELREVLDLALSTKAQTRKLMASRAIQLVNQRYGWEVVAGQMAALYRWILGGPQPSFVEVL